ncbi:hypothetical protein RDE2_12030 [Rhodococcus sp. RDE2]|nr:hypothetical protein RDE2_12030 [Rhodococcus sp. RDE2]
MIDSTALSASDATLSAADWTALVALPTVSSADWSSLQPATTSPIAAAAATNAALRRGIRFIGSLLSLRGRVPDFRVPDSSATQPGFR